jgi:cystathionine beta-lyase
MLHDFDRIIDRRSSDSDKWHYYGEDVLPLWVADMDFASPEPVLRALRQRVDHGVFGYPKDHHDLQQLLVGRLQQLYNWQVEPKAVIPLPGVVAGFNLATRAVTSPGDGVLVQTPIYCPILDAPGNAGCSRDEMELTRQPDGSYSIDYDLFEATITERTRIFILCNPHNPVGRVFRRDELEHLAELCLRHDLVICSDEIHCDLLFQGNQHLPIATLAPEVAERAITLMAPTKTYNIAGLHCSVAIIQNKELRKQFLAAGAGLIHGINIMGQVAALAAYQDGQPWLDAVLSYLEANRDLLYDYVQAHLPGMDMSRPEGTYLAWLDCRQAGLPGNPHKFFLKKAKVAMNNGATYGRGGEGFVRLNFGCPRLTLMEALDRMRQALLDVG